MKSEQTWLIENGRLKKCPVCPTGKLFVNHYGYYTNGTFLGDKVIECICCSREWDYIEYLKTGELKSIRREQ